MANTYLSRLNHFVTRFTQTKGMVEIDLEALEQSLPEFSRARTEYEGYESRRVPRAAASNEVLHQIVAGSINFCFWGQDGGPTQLWHIVRTSVEQEGTTEGTIEQVMETIKPLSWPLSSERQAILRRLKKTLPSELERLTRMIEPGNKAETVLEAWAKALPDFARDILLKRLCLALELLHEDTGALHGIEELPIPADYQVPKVLHSWGVLKYTPQLESQIQKKETIAAQSPEEWQIRCATIGVGQIIFQRTGCPPHVADRFLWQQRKHYPEPHHRTETTAY